MTGSPDARYREDQECWHHGRPLVAAIPLVDGARPYQPQDPAHAANAEARRAIHRALYEARVARDALTRFIGECDRALDKLNGGGW